MLYPLIFVVYVLSAYLLWLHIHLSHSKGGRYEHSNVKPVMVFFVICPLLNTVMTLTCWIGYWPVKRNSEKNLRNFFNIK